MELSSVHRYLNLKNITFCASGGRTSFYLYSNVYLNKGDSNFYHLTTGALSVNFCAHVCRKNQVS